MMKILLVAVNAKYIHTCPAVYSLKAYTDAKGIPGVWTDVAEYTINDRYRDVLDGIMLSEADVIAFSTYIWNVDRVRRLIRDLRAIRGDSVMLWAGGPEVTYGPEPFLGEGGADLCMTGEGEETFAALASFFAAGGHGRTDVPGGLSGIAYLDCATGDLIRTGMGKMIPLDEIPFPYEETERFKDRLLYYEASRGCPFSCAYCLSGPERGTRYRSLEAVEEHLQFFLD